MDLTALLSMPHGHLFPIAAVAIMAVEFLWYRLHGRDGYDLRESAATLGVMVGQVALRTATGLLLLPVYAWVYGHRLFDIPAGSPVALVGLFLLVELTYYWFHRFSHTIRWMWATHAVHHSSTRMNFSAAYRLGWTNLISGGWLFFVPLLWLGFDPAAVFGMLAANLAYQFLLHTELVGSLGPLEWVLNTPRHHCVHHATNASCIDRNFGGVLIVFDRLFGTFAAAPAGEALSYGVAGGRKSYNPLRIAFNEWTAIGRDLWRAGSLRHAVRLAFGRP